MGFRFGMRRSNGGLAHRSWARFYHDRMPLALADDKVALWLDLSQESPPDQNLLLDLTEFTVRPMDRAMNNVRQKNLAAIDPEAEAA
jgi:putative SOS response-associated peptidase YedK